MAGAVPTASPPVVTPGGTTAWNFETWQKKLEKATHQRRKFIPRVDEGDRPYGQHHIRKAARMTVNTLGSSAVGTGLLYQDPTSPEATVTPAGTYIAVAWSANQVAANDIPIDSEMGAAIEQAMAEGDETTMLALCSGLTSILSDATADAAMIRNALARLQYNTNGFVEAGSDTIYAIFHVSQYPHLMSIDEFKNAEIRGDSENPAIKGIWAKGGGVMLMLSTVVNVGVSGADNCIWVPSAFTINWNQHAQTERQSEELQRRLIIFDHFGGAVKHDTRAVLCRTTNNAIA